MNKNKTPNHRDIINRLSPAADEIEKVARFTARKVKRLIVLIIGTTILLVGIAMIILPGPALVFIPIGLSILGTEYAWARKIWFRIKGIEEYSRNKLKIRSDRKTDDNYYAYNNNTICLQCNDNPRACNC